MGYIIKGNWDENFRIKTIVYYVLQYGHKSDRIIEYFITGLDVIKHHHAKLKLNKCRWF